MRVCATISEIRAAVFQAKAAGKKVGFVPTMGALHAGHFSLIEAARRECGFVVVSIFVNPTQFGPNEDLSKYPRPLEADLAGCRKHGADAVLVPSVEQLYPHGPGNVTTSVHMSGLSEHLCGASRKGHFDGVCLVVTKLFNIVLPNVAYFGAKDCQQSAVVRRMAADLDMPLEIKVCPTVREPDGLAMSSRNVYLSPAQRAQATALSQGLKLAAGLVAQGQRDSAKVTQAVTDHLASAAPLGKPEYIEIIDPDSLAIARYISGPVVMALAVKFPSARLIDNMLLTPPKA